MLVSDKEAMSRLASPLNLINRLGSSTSKNGAMSLFGIGKNTTPAKENKPPALVTPRVEVIEDKIREEVSFSFNPFAKQIPPGDHSSQSLVTTSSSDDERSESPKIDDLIDNADNRVKLSLAHDKALTLLNNSLDQLTAKLDDVKAEKLPAVIAAASKTVDGIRRERNEAAKNGKDQEVHFHFYTPEQKKISDYQVIEVG